MAGRRKGRALIGFSLAAVLLVLAAQHALVRLTQRQPLQLPSDSYRAWPSSGHKREELGARLASTSMETLADPWSRSTTSPPLHSRLHRQARS